MICYHLNSILQPATGTKAPVIGVAITTEVPVAGCATGATHITDCEEAARFMLEVAKATQEGSAAFTMRTSLQRSGSSMGI